MSSPVLHIDIKTNTLICLEVHAQSAWNHGDPTTLVSLRITDEMLEVLDGHIGREGLRNRSDVLRHALQTFLQQQPKLIGLGSVTIPLGRTVQRDLANLYELDGTSPEQAALEGLQLLIESRLDRMERRSDRFDQQLADARTATTPRKEFAE